MNEDNIDIPVYLKANQENGGSLKKLQQRKIGGYGGKEDQRRKFQETGCAGKLMQREKGGLIV